MQRPKLTMQSLGNERNRYSLIKEKTLSHSTVKQLYSIKKLKNKGQRQKRERERDTERERERERDLSWNCNILSFHSSCLFQVLRARIIFILRGKKALEKRKQVCSGISR